MTLLEVKLIMNHHYEVENIMRCAKQIKFNEWSCKDSSKNKIYPQHSAYILNRLYLNLNSNEETKY